MISSAALRRILALTCLLAVSGCDMLGDVSNMFEGGTGKKSTLRGVRIPVMASEEDLKIDDTLKDTPVLLPAPYVNPDWPQPGGYAGNAMYHLQAPGALDEVWTADAGKGSDDDSRLTASPVTGAGRIYVLDSEAHLFAFNLSNGNKAWSKSLAPRNGTNWPTLWGLLGKANTIQPPKGMGGGVAYDNGRVFVTSGFGVIYAMNAANGNVIWRHDMTLPILNAPVVNGGRVFFSTYDNHFFVLAESDGRLLWDYQGIPETAGVLASTSAAVSGEFVAAPFTSGELVALRVQNGTIGWSDILSKSGQVTALSELDDIAGRPVIDRGVVYAVSQSGVMAAIGLSSGERLWTKNIASVQTPWAAGDYVYVLDTSARIICLTRKDGKVRWIHELPRWENPDSRTDPLVWTGPILVSNKLIVTSADGKAEAISPYTGAYLGQFDLPGGTSVAPIVANGVMYVYTDDAELVALK